MTQSRGKTESDENHVSEEKQEFLKFTSKGRVLFRILYEK